MRAKKPNLCNIQSLKKMKLLVTGSRTLTKGDGRLLLLGLATVQEIAGRLPVLLLHGGAMGADAQADAWAKAHGIPVEVVRPDYGAHGTKAAPLLRNLVLVERADWVLGVYAPGRDRKGGTWYTVQAAVNLRRPVVEVLADGRIEITMPAPTLFG